MRLHHLSMTAFGPFADTATVDFDELSAAGLFLLTGATGAGKTSVLDAVCFALYGQVPGDRAGAKHLRSDHAARHQAPEVVLRFSVGTREFTFTRSPAWMRPKLRGRGETKVQAHVLIEELRNGAWTVLTNRLDDAGLLVTDLLGMTCTQFTQVALLPQGRFQAFLRASSAERHDVLQHLFRTDRFERIEDWLVARRTEARRASEAGAESVQETLTRLCEVSAEDAAPDWLGDVASAADDGNLQRWLTHLAATAEADHAKALAASLAADDQLARRTAAQAEAVRINGLQVRARAATADLEHWTQRQIELERCRVQLSEHYRAVALTGLARGRAIAERDAAAAAERWQVSKREIATAVADEVTSANVSLALRRAQDAHAVAAAFSPRARAHREARIRLEMLAGQLQEIESGIAELELKLAAQPGLIAEAVADVAEARAAAARHPVAHAAVARLEADAAAARRAELVSLELAAARTDVLAATDIAQQRRETYLDLREARINGMAGELAGQLAAGCSCPVCGSATHPSPALIGSSAVGRAEEDQARKALEDADFELQARQVGLAALEGEMRSLEQRLDGIDRATVTADLDMARDEVERLEPLVTALGVLVAREAECRARLERTEAEHRAALLTRVELRVQHNQVEAALAELDEAWAELLSAPGAGPDEDPGSDPADYLPTLIDLRARAAATLADASATLNAWEAASARAEELDEQLRVAAADAGFADIESALASVLPDDVVQQREADLDQADLAAHAAQLTLGDPDVAVALAAPVPDLAAAEALRATAEQESRRALAERLSCTARRDRVAALRAEAQARLQAWEPARERHRLVASLSAFVEGKGPDNPQRMRLAAFVLAERLRQVVDAANERLAGMTDQRYALEHSDDRGFGEQRGGLSLRVRDDWNGVQRDPATLSGGETFVVSLALALGLADTVAHEAGGTDIDTLFVDEGFGSLDADTLEDVMDTLDSLRDGGRVVGLVSHVPELRSRITTQLEVSKGRAGSSVRAAVSAG